MATICLADDVRALHAGARDARAYVAGFLERIRERDAQILAWAAIDEPRALAKASECQHWLASARELGPLHAVPIGVKDIIDTAELPTELGSPIFRGRRPERDAAVVVRLQQAGAYVLGKTVTTELAYMQPGKTRNPWQLEHTPGGSSSGSAAAVAARCVPAAIGTQTNGSVIRPAAYCGVVGFKPTVDAIPFGGTAHFSETLDTLGTFTLSVADAAYFAARLVDGEAIPSRIERLERPPHIAALDRFPWNEPEAEAVLHFDAALNALRAAGAHVEMLTLPALFGDAKSCHRTIMLHEAARLHGACQSQHRALMSRALNAAIDEGGRISLDAYRAATALRAALVERAHDLFEPYDAVLSLPAPGPAPRLDSTGDPSFCTLWSLLGVPAISLPSGWSRAGLPFGVQLAADAGADAHLLRVAQWCEAVLRFAPSP